jgi:hypothetical protein
MLGRGCYIGEASGYINKPKALEILHDFFPRARIITIFRHPYKRLWSWHLNNNHKDPFLRHYRNYMNRGIFDDYENMKVVYSLFPRDQVLVLKGEDMFCNPQLITNQCFDHLKLPHLSVNIMAHNVTGKHKQKAAGMTENHRRTIRGEWKWRTEKFYELIGRDMGWKI